MTFSFRLQTVADLRVAERDQTRLRLAEAHRAEALLKDQITQLGHELESLREQARAATRPGSLNVDSLLGRHRYELLLHAQQQQLHAQLGQIAEEVEKRRLAVVAADQQVKVLDKLREKQWHAYREAEDRREGQHLDEVALQRYWRTRGER